MTKTPLVSCYCDITVQFYDIDPMCIVWHGNYVKFLEQARCVLLDKIDYNYNQMEASGYIWPIVDMRLKYVSSARFGDVVRVHAQLVEYENRLKINYMIVNAVTEVVLTKAHTIQVAVDSATQEMQFESPAIMFEQVEKLLNE